MFQEDTTSNDSETTSIEDQNDEPPLMTEDEILLCYWKISVRPFSLKENLQPNLYLGDQLLEDQNVVFWGMWLLFTGKRIR